MKKNLKLITTIFVFILFLSGFYFINDLNFRKHIEIQNSFIEHPEDIATKEFASNTAFGFKNLKADLYWLKTIQYIGSNPIGAEYKKFLFIMIDLITHLNPYFEHPYNIGQLLLPDYNANYENQTEATQQKNIGEGIKLGLKGIKNFCNPDIIDLIDKEDNLKAIWSEDKYKNPCKSFSVPYYLAYVYYFYKNDLLNSAKYYKVASAIEGSPRGLKSMAAVMTSKGGAKEKSFFMFLNLASFVDKDNEICKIFSSNLEVIGQKVLIKKEFPLNGELLKNIDTQRIKYFGDFHKTEEETNMKAESQCDHFINKSIRELNLEYLTRADKQYYSKFNKHSKNTAELFETGFIDYEPIDFQQYEEHGIQYIFDEKLGIYDYESQSYK